MHDTRKKVTTLWLRDDLKTLTTVDRDVTCVDEASRIMGFPDYKTLVEQIGKGKLHVCWERR